MRRQKKAYCIIATGEKALYANIMLRESACSLILIRFAADWLTLWRIIMDYAELREQMCDVCHKMWQLGWVAGQRKSFGKIAGWNFSCNTDWNQ